MLGKKGIELSLNFIVILIISITIFGFGVKFIYDLSQKATELQNMEVADLDSRISNLVCEGSDRVCVGIDKKEIRRGKFAVFGLKIINVIEPDPLCLTGGQQKFNIEVKNPDQGTSQEFFGFKKDNQKIDPSNTPSGFRGLQVLPRQRDVKINKNEEKNLGIGVQVPDNAPSGTYILNIYIKTKQKEIVSACPEKDYSVVQKLYVEVP